MGVKAANLEGVVDAEVLTLEEELTGKAVDEFRARVEELLEGGKSQFVLDLAPLKVVSSQGLEALLWVVEEAQAAGGAAKIASPGPTVCKIFELVQFDHVFEIYGDVLEALKNF